MKPHEVREFVNRLTKIAKERGTHQCIRDCIAKEVMTTLLQANVVEDMQHLKPIVKV